MKKRILSILLALALLCGSMAGLGMTAAAADADFGWDAMQGDFAMRVTQNGSEVTRLIVGETYQLQVWMQKISPYSIVLPIGWNPAVVSVVDSATGNAVATGRKYQEAGSGFRTGACCSDYDYDPDTWQPLYWTGEPVFTSSEVEGNGYPYLDVSGGCYRLMYYTLTPATPAQPQLLCELSFSVEASGNPNFHIATKADGDGHYDPAEPNGVAAVVASKGSSAKTVSYSTKVKSPAVTAYTLEEYEALGRDPATGGQTPDTELPDDEADAEELPEETFQLVKARHLSCFPYQNTMQTVAELDSKTGEYVLPASKISQLTAQAGKTTQSILVNMPAQIIDKNEYALRFDLSSMDAMSSVGLLFLYVETPWGYVGLNTMVLSGQLSSSELCLTVSPRSRGVNVAFTAGGTRIAGLNGAVLRVILPLEGSAHDILVTGTDVFGTGTIRNQPLNLCTVDTDAEAVIFQSPSFCGFDVTTGSAASFTDLAGASWAEESIQTLVKKNVLSGVGGGKFAPNSAVTREQYVKMLVCTLGMYKASETAQVFTDVPTTNYFHPYLASAKAAGISNGQSGGKFGIKQTITRQDLVVMTYRALTQMGLVPEAVRSVTTFADDAQISSYAREAVYALYAAGIIDGMGANTFAPTKTATRAQAAKIMAGVLALVQDAL